MKHDVQSDVFQVFAFVVPKPSAGKHIESTSTSQKTSLVFALLLVFVFERRKRGFFKTKCAAFLCVGAKFAEFSNPCAEW